MNDIEFFLISWRKKLTKSVIYKQWTNEMKKFNVPVSNYCSTTSGFDFISLKIANLSVKRYSQQFCSSHISTLINDFMIS